jgi:transposase
MTRLTQDEIAALRYHKARGKSLRWIAKTLGRSFSTVQYHAKKSEHADPEEQQEFEAELAAQIATDIKAHRVKPFTYKKPESQNLLEILPFDLHILKYAWGAETVTSFDVETAIALFKWSVEDLLAKAQRHGVDRILMVVGNDVLHVDGPNNMTTGGTPMDVDTRFFRGFMRAREAHSWAIRRAAEVAPVDVVVVRGNHDNTSAWHLGYALQLEFDSHPNVFIENSMKPRKYYMYGVNLLGFTHGNEEKVSDLPLIMAREVPQFWAASEHREWHIGHLHKYKETAFLAGDAFAGTRVRIVASLTAHDNWHTKSGYMDRRAMEAFLHSKKAGYLAHFSANVDHFTGQPMKEGA